MTHPAELKSIIREVAAPWVAIYSKMPDGERLIRALYAGMSDRIAQLMDEPRIEPIEPRGQFYQGHRLADELSHTITRLAATSSTGRRDRQTSAAGTSRPRSPR